VTERIRARLWVDDEMTEEILPYSGDPEVLVVARRMALSYVNERTSHQVRAIVDDPDDEDAEPWFEAREDGIMLVYGRSVSPPTI
jgi:hypothetical protein